MRASPVSETESAGWLIEFSDRLPALVAALAIVFAGWLLARAARAGGRQVANGLNRLLERGLRSGNLATARLPSGAIAVTGEVLFWGVLLVALALAARVAGVPLFNQWLDAAIVQLPHLLIGALVIAVGWAVAARLASSGEAGVPVARRLAQGLIVAVAMVVGLAQMGLDMRLPVVLLGIAVGAAFLGFSIAFGLGARDYVAAGIAGRALAAQLQRGLRVRIGAHEGEVIDLTATHLLLDAEEGQLLLPLSEALRADILLLRGESGGGQGDA